MWGVCRFVNISQRLVEFKTNCLIPKSFLKLLRSACVVGVRPFLRRGDKSWGGQSLFVGGGAE